MQRKNIISEKEKEIEITKINRQISISQEGIEVQRKGKPISFEPPESGVAYLVIDCSGSMEGNKIEQAKQGAVDFAEDAKERGYSIGLIQFHSYTTHLCEPVRDILLLKRKIEKITIGDLTHMAEAINFAHQKLRNKKGVRVMVIVTDGMPNGPGDPEASLRAGASAKQDGIEIITIGTDNANRKFLKKLASKSGLGKKVPRNQLGQAIASAADGLPMLPKKGSIR